MHDLNLVKTVKLAKNLWAMTNLASLKMENNEATYIFYCFNFNDFLAPICFNFVFIFGPFSPIFVLFSTKKLQIFPEDYSRIPDILKKSCFYDLFRLNFLKHFYLWEFCVSCLGNWKVCRGVRISFLGLQQKLLIREFSVESLPTEVKDDWSRTTTKKKKRSKEC